MTLNQFVDKWVGKNCDWDGNKNFWCVDLFRQYLQEVLRVAQPQGVQGASDFWDSYDTDSALQGVFQRIKNTPAGIPAARDVVIWGKGLGKYGHIAIFLSGDVKKFTSFDQNFPVGSACNKVEHNYKNVLGWLHLIADGSLSDTEKIKKIEEKIKEIKEIIET